MSNERTRRLLAFGGLGLWVAYPFFYMAGSHAEWVDRCGQRAYTGHFDDCFNDALPVDIVAFPLTILLFYPVARVAFCMFAPPEEQRTTRWRWATRNSASVYFPLFHAIVAIGLAWSIWHLRSVPLVATNWYLVVYWLAWIGWLIAGAIFALPQQMLSNSPGR